MSVNLVKLRKVTPSNSNPSYEPLDSMEFGDINNSVNDSPNSSERFTRPSRHFLIVPFLVFIW